MRTFTRLAGLTDIPEYWARIEAASGRLAFDVGANIGQASKVLAQHFERVIAFEPCAETAAVLAGAVPANVTVMDVAVSDLVGLVDLDESAGAIGYGMLTSGGHPRWGVTLGRRTVPALSLDAAVRRFGRPDLVKVDTEGHELPVLEGARNLIRYGRTVWLLELHDDLEEKVRAYFGGYQITRFDHQPDLYYLEVIPS
jgi:FkbM family methyltransferase